MTDPRFTPILPDTPAAIVVQKFEARGIRQADLARLLKVERSTVTRWLRAAKHGGTNGLIPATYHARIMDAAKLNRVKLRAADLVLKPSKAES